MGTNAEAIHKYHTPVAHCPVCRPRSHVQAHNLTEDAPANLQCLSPTYSPVGSLPPAPSHTHEHDGLTHIGSHIIHTGLLHSQAHAVAQNRTYRAYTYTRHSLSLVSSHSPQHSQVSRCLIQTPVSPSPSPRGLSLLVIFHTQGHHLPNTLRSLLHCPLQPPHSPDPAETAASTNPACRPRKKRRAGLWEM